MTTMAPPVSADTTSSSSTDNGQRCPSLSPPGRNFGKMKLGDSGSGSGMDDSLLLEDSTRCLLSPLHEPDSSKTMSKKMMTTNVGVVVVGGGNRLPSISPPRERCGSGSGNQQQQHNNNNNNMATLLDDSTKCLLSPLHERRPTFNNNNKREKRETRGGGGGGGGSRGRSPRGSRRTPRQDNQQHRPDRFSSTEVVFNGGGGNGGGGPERQTSTTTVVLGEPIMPRKGSKERLDVLSECSSHSSNSRSSGSSSSGAPTRMTSDAVGGSSNLGGGGGASSPAKSAPASSSSPKECDSCGYDNIPDGAKFCPGCGSNLNPEYVCGSCGYDPIPEGAKFCPGCGSSTTAAATSPSSLSKKRSNNDPLGSSSSHSHSSHNEDYLLIPKNRPRRLANKKRGSNEGLYAMKERLLMGAKDSSFRSTDSKERLEKLTGNSNRVKESSNTTNTNIAPEKIGKIIPSDQAYNDIIIDNWDLEDFNYEEHFELENDRKTATAAATGKNDPSSSGNSKTKKSSSSNSVVSYVQITNRYKLYYRDQRIYEISTTSGCDGDKRVGQACTCALQGPTMKVKRSNLSSSEGVPLVVESFVLNLEDLVRKAAYARQEQMLRNEDLRGGGGGGTTPNNKSSSGGSGSRGGGSSSSRHHHQDDRYNNDTSYRSGNHRCSSGSGSSSSNNGGGGGNIYIRLINRHMNVNLEKRRSKDEKPASVETAIDYGRKNEHLANIIFKDSKLKQMIKFPSDLVQGRKDKAKEIYLEVKSDTIGTIKWDYQQLKKYTFQNLLDAVDWRKGRKINIHIGIG